MCLCTCATNFRRYKKIEWGTHYIERLLGSVADERSSNGWNPAGSRALALLAIADDVRYRHDESLFVMIL